MSVRPEVSSNEAGVDWPVHAVPVVDLGEASIPLSSATGLDVTPGIAQGIQCTLLSAAFPTSSDLLLPPISEETAYQVNHMDRAPPSKFLARLLGPTAIVLAVTEFKNAEIFPSPDPAVVYLDGAVLFVSGLSIILNHNRWSPGWPILITILGWLSLGLGLSRMVWPTAKLDDAESWVVVTVEGLLFMAGVLLCLMGYRRG